VRVRWLRAALANLDAEAEYVAEDNPAAAGRVVQKILRAMDLLKKNPAMGRMGNCGDAGTGRCRNAVHHSLSSSRRRGGGPPCVSRGAEWPEKF